MWINIFYADDMKCKNTDVFEFDSSTCKRVLKDLEEGKKTLVFRPGEVYYHDKGGMHVLDYYQFINMENVAKVVVSDVD